jgi:hypothetical protein
MKIQSAILYLTFSLLSLNYSFGQEHQYLNQSGIIKRNNVYKMLEYNPEDSLKYFESYPIGTYSKYDKLGRMTMSNHYSPYYSDSVWHPNMCTNYYLYDSLSNKVGFAQIHEEMESPFRFFEINSFEVGEDSIKTARLSESWQMNSEFIFSTESKMKNEPFFGDTISLSKRHKQLYSLRDSSIFKDIYLNNKGKADSTIFHSTCSGQIGEYPCETIIYYKYYRNGEIKSGIEEHYTSKQKRELYSIEKYNFLENGLLDNMSTYYAVTNNTTLSKFKYFMRKH